MRAYWHALRDARDVASGFNAMLERFGVLSIQALRLAGNEFAYRVAPTSFRQLMEILVARQRNGMSISVSVSGAGVTQTHTGLIRELNIIGPWLAIREPDFVLRLREDRIHTAWVVKKPSDDGIVTSLELYGARGENIAVLSAPCRHGQTCAETWGGVMAILRPLEPM